MSTVQRIATLRCHGGLVDRLSALAHRPLVESFRDPFTALPRLHAFRPDVILVEASRLTEQDIGGLRTLRALESEAQVVLVSALEHEVDLRPLVRTLGARVLLEPSTDAELAASLAVTRDEQAPDAFVDLARGIADEINNPLLLTRGYLQLLEEQLGPEVDPDLEAHVLQIRGGLKRIGRSVAKLQILHRVARLQPGDFAPVAVAALLGDALRRTAHTDAGRLELSIPDDAIDTAVLGDGEALASALEEFCVAGRALAKSASHAVLQVEAVGDGPPSVRIVMELHDSRLPAWEFPRTYAPYFLNRVLRGTPHGLSLFLVQSVVHAHGGRATARRLPEGSGLRFELVLGGARPSAPSTAPG